MDDLKLLALAAKAHGFIDDQLSEEDDQLGLRRNGQGIYYIVHKFGWHNWEPLSDDGDALRLAVKLGHRIDTPKYKGFGSSCGNQTVFQDGCPYAQTRRAIVRAAAEIGKAMP